MQCSSSFNFWTYFCMQTHLQCSGCQPSMSAMIIIEYLASHQSGLIPITPDALHLLLTNQTNHHRVIHSVISLSLFLSLSENRGVCGSVNGLLLGRTSTGLYCLIGCALCTISLRRRAISFFCCLALARSFAACSAASCNSRSFFHVSHAMRCSTRRSVLNSNSDTSETQQNPAIYTQGSHTFTATKFKKPCHFQSLELGDLHELYDSGVKYSTHQKGTRLNSQ